jgi:hypothetical protein
MGKYCGEGKRKKALLKYKYKLDPSKLEKIKEKKKANLQKIIEEATGDIKEKVEKKFISKTYKIAKFKKAHGGKLKKAK